MTLSMVSPAFRHLRTEVGIRNWKVRVMLILVCLHTLYTVSACVHLQMLSMEMSRNCSYMDGWLFLLELVLRVD